MAAITIDKPANGATVSKYVFFASGTVESVDGIVVICVVIPNGQQNPVATCTPCPIYIDLSTGATNWAAVFANLSVMQGATLKAIRTATGVADEATAITIDIADVPPAL